MIGRKGPELSLTAARRGVCGSTASTWELTRDDPIVDIRLIGRRQFGTSFFVMMAVGAVLFGATQLMPQLLQEQFDYTATRAGLALMPGGFAAMTSMMAAGQVSRFVQPRYMMAGGLIAISLALYHFTALAPEADFWWFAWARVYQMVGIPFLLLTITTCRGENRGRRRRIFSSTGQARPRLTSRRKAGSTRR